MAISIEDLKTMRILESSATAGPWSHDDGVVRAANGFVIARAAGSDDALDQDTYADIELIVAARNALPALLDEVVHLRGVVDRLATRVARLEAQVHEGR